jgi:hypothetical protein
MRTVFILTSLAHLAIALPSKPEPRASNFKCPVRDIVQTQCLGPTDCLYANPDNCASYIKCEVNPDETTGTPHVVPCPLGSKWNDREKRCDFLVRMRGLGVGSFVEERRC